MLRSTITVGGMTLISRFFGLFRDITLAMIFGASGGTDAFLVAFKIPNFMRRLFAEGAFSQAFVPVFAEYKEKHSREALQDLVNHVAGSLGSVLLAITLAGVIASPVVAFIFSPGFWFEEGSVRFALTSDLLRITFPYIFFISLVAFTSGIMNSFNQFAVPAFTPVLLNVCLIVAAFWATPYFEEPLMALAWAVAAAGLLQLLFQYPFLRKLKLIPRPKLKRHHEGVDKIKRLMIPAIIGSSVAQINLLLDTVIASFLITGSVSWLYYSDRLLEFPLGVLGIAVATVILPALSRHHAQESLEKFNQTLNWAIQLVLLIALPACVGLFLLAAPVLATLFQHGEFSQSDTYMSSLSLMAYIIGLPAFILIKVLAPGFYARQDTKTPVRIGIIALIANMLLNIVLVVPLVMFDFEAPHVGLALATSMSGFLNAYLLYRTLVKTNILTPLPGLGLLVLRIAIACAAMAGCILFITPELALWSDWSVVTRIGAICLIILLSALSYFIVLWGVGLRLSQLKHS